MSEQDWDYFRRDPQYSDVLKRRLDQGVEMDSALALARYMQKHFSGNLDVLDFGGGPGHYYPVIRKNYTQGTVRYLAVDIDASNVAYGSEHFRDDPDCAFVVGSVLEPASVANTANCIVSANTLPHVPSIEPLLRYMAATPRIHSFAFRMLIGPECVQIKKHLQERDFDGMFERNFQFNNIYSMAYLSQLLGEEWTLTEEPDSFDPERLAQHRVPAQDKDAFYGNRVSRAEGSMIFKGAIYMPWRFVLGRRRQR